MPEIEILRIAEFRTGVAPDGEVVFTITTVDRAVYHFGLSLEGFIGVATQMARDGRMILASPEDGSA